MLPPLPGLAGLSGQKTIARERLKLERRSAARARPDAARFAAAHFMSAPFMDGHAPDQTIALYHPIGDELDTEPLFDALSDRSASIALPVTPRGRAPLQFYSFQRGDRLADGRHGVKVPAVQSVPVTPAIIVAPLLGFTAQGARLGYGGGYYDRTISALRDTMDRPPLYVGFAFSAQEVDDLPVNDLDQSLDWIITEARARRCR